MPQMIAPEKVQTRQCTINDAQEFLEAVQGSEIAVILISAQDVRDKETSLGLIEMFENAVPIRGIAEYHCIGIDGNRNLTRGTASDVIIPHQKLTMSQTQLSSQEKSSWACGIRLLANN